MWHYSKLITALLPSRIDSMREEKKQVSLISSSVTLHCSQGSLLEGKAAQFICVINVEIPSAPGQAVDPNSILKAGILWKHIDWPGPAVYHFHVWRSSF